MEDDPMSNEKKTCDLKPVNTKSATDFKICNCKNVTYFNILDALEKHSKVENLLDVFEDVKKTTHCSTGCGGCYDRVLKTISDVMMSK
jgi:NAD(P)H-nitrite reductase large subunit